MATPEAAQKNEKSTAKALKDRERCIYYLKLLSWLHLLFLVYVVGFFTTAMLFFVQSTSAKTNWPWPLVALVNVVNGLAIVVFYLGVKLMLAELIYGYLVLNGIWVFGTTVSQVILILYQNTHAELCLISLLYASVNVCTMVVVYYLIVNLHRHRKTISVNSKRSVSLLSKTDTFTVMPVGFGSPSNKTAADASVTEATLKFQDSVHR